MNTLRTGAVILALLLGPSLFLGAQANDWSIKDKNGVRYTLSGLHGKWVLVNFWAPWCPDCLHEIPDLVALQTRHKDIQVIGVAVMYGSKKEVNDVVQTQSVSYPIVFGNEDIASDFGGMAGMPTSFLYSPAGKLVIRHEGAMTQTEIEQAITKSGAN